MLELKNIRTVYGTQGEKVEALKGVSIKFRESEFVSILGQSGCGKTTLLNIIGGLDRYTSGDLIINSKSTKKFKDRDWDAYRNYKIGFVFQSYNLIGHQTVLSNVELALTIGGINKRERRAKAIKALEEVGLKDQIHKKPNQLSGGQMQRVAIARALVNNPDIILADEPTGALDTKTSVQVMEILKKISKDKLIIMVTHNPELAEKYSSRIIKILDGCITQDSNPITADYETPRTEKHKIGRTSMKFWTALRLSLNNLLTKKGRTILIAFAGSIGIIGIALVQSVSNGFQAYVDHIQEDTLTSYPLSIMQESSDLTSALLSMATNEGEKNDSDILKEEQYITDVLDTLSTNDLRSFNKYMNSNYEKIKNDISSIKYAYSVEPLIYSKNNEGKILKVNPNTLFSSPYGSSSMMGSFTSVYNQMIDNKELLNNSYDVLAGHWPEKYNEMIIVLTERGVISDYLIYYLGLRDIDELTDIVNKIMTGETVELNNEPMQLSYEDLMNIDLRLIMQSDTYKYNERYNIYEDMSEDEEYFTNLYTNATELKIVGVVAPKEGITSMSLNPGIAYTSMLTDYIIQNAANSDIVKKQLENKDIDVFSNTRFDEKKNNSALNFNDLMEIDTNMLQSAFNIKVDQEELQNKTAEYMSDISNAVTTDITPAKNAFSEGFNTLANGLLNSITNGISLDDIDSIVENYLNTEESDKIITSLETDFVIPKDVFKAAYSGLLKGLLNIYVGTTSQYGTNIPPEMVSQMIPAIVSTYLSNETIEQTISKMAQTMTEAVMKKTILQKVGELTANLTSSFSTAFNIDQNKIAGAFKMKITEDEITRIITAMMSKTDTTAKGNLLSLGYQDIEEPTYMSFYFNSFDGKENFLDFLDNYNKKMEEAGEDDKVINYTDTTGILMGSVKTIVNAVTYVLIAFISISLIVSSIMIGIITYISVYERTKEIGILRAIGASKKNISSIFNAETFIIGLLSGLIGIGVTYSLIPGINAILHAFTGNIPLNATFYANNAIALVILSVILTLIGGLIPAKAASKKDPVIALRTE